MIGKYCGVARVFQQGGQSEERSDRWGGGVGNGREIFENLCIKMTSFAH